MSAEMRGPMHEEDQCYGGRNPVFKNDAQRLWLERMTARGWTAPEWPKVYGGGGLGPAEAAILSDNDDDVLDRRGGLDRIDRPIRIVSGLCRSAKAKNRYSEHKRASSSLSTFKSIDARPMPSV